MSNSDPAGCDPGIGKGQWAGRGESATLNRLFDLIPIAIIAGLVLALLLPALALLRYWSAERTSRSNLRELAQAMLACNAAEGSLPSHAIYSKDGEPLLSWRVALLPYLGHRKLYDEFHLDEPWDSEHNRKLLPRMPLVYAPPLPQSNQEPYVTYYQVFVGAQAPFGGPVRARVPQTFQHGTANTLLIVEAGEPVPWTKPQDLPYDPVKPLPKLGGLFGKYFNGVTADGSVHTLTKGPESEQMLRQAIDPYDSGICGDW